MGYRPPRHKSNQGGSAEEPRVEMPVIKKTDADDAPPLDEAQARAILQIPLFPSPQQRQPAQRQQ